MIFWLATTNRHKIREIKAFFKNRFPCYDPSGLAGYFPPEETGQSFRENAEIKACHLASFLKPSDHGSDSLILGEDSGLEVRALNGQPGIFSARYSGLKATDSENNQLLLENMKGKPKEKRSAAYVCAICCLFEGEKVFFEGRLKGHLAFHLKGSNGFGYDPLFVPEGESQTLGELSDEFKEKISHRVQALRLLKLHFSL